MPSKRRRKPIFPMSCAFSVRRYFFGRIMFAMLAVVTVFVLIRVSLLLRDLSGDMALSDARDAAVDTVNEAMLLMMSRGTYDYDYFVDIGLGEDGQVTSPTGVFAVCRRRPKTGIRKLELRKLKRTTERCLQDECRQQYS